MVKIKIEIIDDYLKDKNLSKNAFCKLCQISPMILKNIYEEKILELQVY